MEKYLLATIDTYEEEIHNKLQKIRYKYNYIINHLKSTYLPNPNNLDTIQLDILKLELDDLDFKLNDYIFEIGGDYPDEKYKEMEDNYLLMLGEKLKEFYQEEQKKNKKMAMKTLLPMLLQVMMLSDKDSIYHTKNNEKGEEINKEEEVNKEEKINKEEVEELEEVGEVEELKEVEEVNKEGIQKAENK